MNILDLPLELLQEVLVQAITVRGLKRGLRLRLVNRIFARETISALFLTRFLDAYFQTFNLDKHMILPPFAAAYLESRVLNEASNGNPSLISIREIAEKLQQESTCDTSMHNYLHQLCLIASRTLCPGARANFWQGTVIMSAERFENDLYVAAVYTRTRRVIERRLASGKCPSEVSWLFGSTLHYAAENWDEDSLAGFLDSTNKDTVEELRNSLLGVAAHAGRAQIMPFIYDYNARQYPWEYSRKKRPRMPYRNEWRLFEMDTPSRKVFAFLTEKRKQHCIDRTFNAKIYTSFLGDCARKGWADMAACYLDLGAAVDGMDGLATHGKGKRPLVHACYHGHQGVVRVLLRYGADTSGPALETAAGIGRLDIVRLLLEHGAELGDALERAAAGGYRDVIEELLNHGADVKGRSGVLLLHAVQYEHVPMFRLLVERGCDLTEADTMERYMKVAEEQGLDSMLELLKQFQMDCDETMHCVEH